MKTRTKVTGLYEVRVWKSKANEETTWLVDVGFWVNRSTRAVWVPVKWLGGKNTKAEAEALAASETTAKAFSSYAASNARVSAGRA